MWQLNKKGYQPSTPQELKDELTRMIREQIPNFVDLPQTLQGNLLEQGTVFLMYQELLTQRLLNYPAPSEANELLFEMMGSERGLRRKGAYKSQVTLRFVATRGTIIPRDFRVQTAGGSVFKTFDENIITATTGYIDVLGYSDDENIPSIAVGEINQIVDGTPNIQVTNLDSPTMPVQKEPFEQYKRRVQNRWKNPKLGSLQSLLGAVENLEGVDGRLVSFKQREIIQNGTTYNAFEVIVGGGDPLEIAYAIFNYGGVNPYRYLSDPSKNETSRRISQSISVRGKSVEVQFTRPKRVDVSTRVKVAFKDMEASNEAIRATTMEETASYINSLRVGEMPNVMGLSNAFMQGIKVAGGSYANISKVQIEFILTDTATKQQIVQDQTGFFVIKFDEYLVLTDYEVEII